MGVREIDRSLGQWGMGVKDLRRRMILAPKPRERWYAILLLAQGLTAAATAVALERDPHTIGRWASAFGEGGPAALMFEQTGGFPPALDQAQQEELRGAVQQPPNTSGIELANWYWKVVRQFVSEQFGVGLSRSSCLNYPRLHGSRLFTGWDLPSSGPRSDWSRLMRPSGRPSWRSTPPCGRRRYILAERYSLLMRPTSGRTRNCGAYGS